MNKRTLGVAALFTSLLATAVPAQAVTLFFAGNFGYRYTYGPKGGELDTALGCKPTCSWKLVMNVPDVPGPFFDINNSTLRLNNTNYTINTGRLSANYDASAPYDLMTFTGYGIPVPVPGMAGDEVLYFNFALAMPKKTLQQTNRRPPTDPNIYLNKLLPDSHAYASLLNFPGNASGESGVRLDTFDSRSAPIYAITQFSSNGIFAIPEPATWMMMISGFGLAGAAMRRRRTVARMAQARVRARAG